MRWASTARSIGSATGKLEEFYAWDRVFVSAGLPARNVATQAAAACGTSLNPRDFTVSVSPARRRCRTYLKYACCNRFEPPCRTIRSRALPPTASAFAIRLCIAASRMPPSASAFACGSASATPPQGGSDTRALYASLSNHSPLEGESVRQGRSPQSNRRGAIAASRRRSPQSNRWGAPVSEVPRRPPFLPRMIRVVQSQPALFIL